MCLAYYRAVLDEHTECDWSLYCLVCDWYTWRSNHCLYYNFGPLAEAKSPAFWKMIQAHTWHSSIKKSPLQLVEWRLCVSHIHSYFYHLLFWWYTLIHLFVNNHTLSILDPYNNLLLVEIPAVRKVGDMTVALELCVLQSTQHINL